MKQSSLAILVESVIESGIKNPRRLFLIDGVGAVISVILLGIVLVEFEQIFGIPRQILYFLAIFPCIYAIYDFFCLAKEPIRIGAFLKAIAVMNLCYSFLSVGLAIYRYGDLTIFGWIFIVLENLTVVTLAYVEYKVAKKLSS